MRGVLTAIVCLVAGCLEVDRPAAIADPEGHVSTVRAWRHGGARDLDLLFAIDHACAMSEEQSSFAIELPRMLSVIARGDWDEDGERDGPRAETIQVGFVEPDMGMGGYTIGSACGDRVYGGDGVLRTDGMVWNARCAATYPNILRYDPSVDLDAFLADAACMTPRGTDGCGLEQQLDAVLKAVTPSTSSIRFVDGTVGHGDGANRGFVRPDSVLAVVVVTDEDDCSARDPEVWDPLSTTYPGALSYRCFEHPDAFHPVSRYVDGLLGLRAPERLVFVTVSGVPLDLTAPRGDDFDTILADDRMTPQMDGDRLAPSCNVPGRGLAFPPRRIVTVARDLHERGAHTAVTSLCQSNFAPAINTALLHIREALGSDCIARALEQVDGRVDCVLTVDGVEQPQLVVNDNGPAPGEGWYYDTTSRDAVACGPGAGRIGFRTPPVDGAEVRLVCHERIP